MNTITNKKGNSGFTASPWNCSHGHYMNEDGEYIDTLLYNPRRDATEFKVQYVVRPVTVKSCGKKQMTLEAHDSKWSNMRGQFFSPELPIYVTKEDAEAYIKAEFDEIGRAGIIRSLRRSADMNREWMESYPNANPKARAKAEAEIQKYEGWADIAESGADILEIVYLTE